MIKDKIILEADSIFQLIGLHRILHKSKFYDELDEMYSEFGSQWSNKVLYKIIDFYRENNDTDKVKIWQEWQNLTENRIEYQVVQNKILGLKEYSKANNKILSNEEKIKNIEFIISPFVLSEELLEKLIKKLD